MKKWNIVEISRKGQLLVPKTYRQKSGIKPGSRVALSAEPNKLFVYVLPEDPIEAACGILKGGPSLATELAKERRAEKEREKKELRR
jgi:AbrB family looped-hinge helix DNA binding protein